MRALRLLSASCLVIAAACSSNESPAPAGGGDAAQEDSPAGDAATTDATDAAADAPDDGPQPGSPWPLFRRTQDHAARATVNGPKQANVKWSPVIDAATQGSTAGSPTIAADGTIYVGSGSAIIRKGGVFAFGPDGKKKWSLPVGLTVVGPAIGHDGTVYVTTSDGTLHAVAPGGTEAWTLAGGKRTGAAATITRDGTIVFGTDSGLYGISPSGTQTWSAPLANGVSQSAAAIADTGDVLAVGSADGSVHAYSTAGAPKWKWTSGGTDVPTSPAYGPDGVLYVAATDGNNQGHVVALDSSGKPKWDVPMPNNGVPTASVAIAADGTVYAGFTGGLLAVKNGAIAWTFAAGQVDSSPAIGADGTIYFGSVDTNLYAVDPGGKQVFAYAVGRPVESSPAIGSDGTLYVGGEDDKLYAFAP